jgi:hypothetical protein
MAWVQCIFLKCCGISNGYEESQAALIKIIITFLWRFTEGGKPKAGTEQADNKNQKYPYTVILRKRLPRMFITAHRILALIPVLNMPEDCSLYSDVLFVSRDFLSICTCVRS